MGAMFAHLNGQDFLCLSRISSSAKHIAFIGKVRQLHRLAKRINVLLIICDFASSLLICRFIGKKGQCCLGHSFTHCSQHEARLDAGQYLCHSSFLFSFFCKLVIACLVLADWEEAKWFMWCSIIYRGTFSRI